MSRKKVLIQGTFLLTLAGFISKIIGFCYRIFLTKQIGAEGIGIYQLVFPVYVMCLSLCTIGLQTALSRFIAEQSNHERNARKILRVGLVISLSLAAVVSVICNQNAAFLAVNVLEEKRCATLLSIMSFSIFPACIHSCLNGYYYGLKKTVLPSVSQLVEQIARVGGAYILYTVADSVSYVEKIEFAVWGVFIGECCSALVSTTAYVAVRTQKEQQIPLLPSKKIFRQLTAQAVPLTMNRVLTNLLQSWEALLIPILLRQYGLNSSQALSLYGILTGMAMPLIMFPNALTNSLSVMLLSEVAESNAQNQQRQIARTIEETMKFSVLLGVFCTGYFLCFGNEIGWFLYQNETAGAYICILAWLCPWIYLSSTLGSVLHGLGKTFSYFIMNIISLIVRIILLFLFMPKYGLVVYLFCLLISQILFTVFIVLCLKKETDMQLNLYNWLKHPLIFLFLSVFLKEIIRNVLKKAGVFHPALALSIESIVFILPFLIGISVISGGLKYLKCRRSKAV